MFRVRCPPCRAKKNDFLLLLLLFFSCHFIRKTWKLWTTGSRKRRTRRRSREGVERVNRDAKRAIIRTLTDGSLSKESHDPDARMFDATLQVIRLFSATIAVYAQWRTRGFLIGPPLCNRPTFLDSLLSLSTNGRLDRRGRSRSRSGYRERKGDMSLVSTTSSSDSRQKDKRWWRQWIEVLWGGTKRASLLI